jgi:hypothetical protein
LQQTNGSCRFRYFRFLFYKFCVVALKADVDSIINFSKYQNDKPITFQIFKC